MKKSIAILLSLALALSLAACGGSSSSQGTGTVASITPPPAATPAGAFTPGTYEGVAKGYNGEVKVVVTVSTDKIEKIDVLENAETIGIGTVALETLPARIIEHQTLAVDAMAGATLSSSALIEAVGAALVAAGGDLADFQAVVPAGSAPRQPATVDVDVVVIGAGGAGMVAALEAQAAGKDVLIVEKMAIAGGNTTRATGGMNAAETSVQKAAGVEDTVQSFIDDTMKGGHGVNNEALVTVMAEQSASAIDWLDSIGAPLPDLTTLGGSSNKRAHRPEGGGAVGSYLVEKLLENVDKAGIPVRYNTTATSILMGTDTDVPYAIGVMAQDDTTELTINAKAVIIATGGFGANEDLYTTYKPELKGFVTTNAPGATGDGIVMAEAAGARLVDMEQIQIHPTVHQATSIMITEGLRGDGAILINQSGERFINEMDTRDVVSAAEIEQEGGYAYLLFDQQLRDNVKAVEGYVTKELTMQGDTLEELAAEIDVDDAVLAKTVEEWNKAVAAKSDPAFGRATGMDRDVSVGPFYAIKIAPGVHHTMGGIAINGKAEVSDTAGKPIPGLFAAGEVTGGVHGDNRLGGNAVADIVIFGRQAGQSAAAYCD